MSAVVHINNNNNDLDVLEKRKSFADMKMVNVTNNSFHTSQVYFVSFYSFSANQENYLLLNISNYGYLFGEVSAFS